MYMSASEAAAYLGVSARRVRALIADQRIPARRVGAQWVIDAADLPSRERRAGRPLSPRMAWALAAIAEPDEQGPGQQVAARLAREEEVRLRRRVRDLSDRADVAPLLRSWMRNRSARHVLSSPVPLDLLQDPRFEPAGVSDPRAGVVTGEDVEGYVLASDLDEVRFDHLIVEPSVRGRRPNVFLHVCDAKQAPYLLSGPKPVLSVAADLADHDGPREDAQANAIVRALLHRASAQAPQ